MTFPREEVEAAWAEFRRRGAEEHDWEGWADLFNEDALYIEHNLGTFHGRAEIRDWIVPTMAAFPSMSLDIDWWIIDGDRVAFYIWNLLPDPAGGGGTDAKFGFPNATVLHYGGDGKWCYEEDFYSPHNAEAAMREWIGAGGNRKLAVDKGLRGIPDFCPAPSPVSHPREEVEAEFARYVQRGKDAVRTGNWNPWADQFTEDARYYEHHYGKLRGREEIRTWINSVMQPFPEMEFPVDWHMIDGNRVVMRCPNVLPDPRGGDERFEFPVFVVLHYAGDGLWSYEEDIYNPDEAPAAIMRWVEAGGKLPEELQAQLAAGEVPGQG